MISVDVMLELNYLKWIPLRAVGGSCILIASCTAHVRFFSSRSRHTRCLSDWSSDVCSSDLRRLRERRGVAREDDETGAVEQAPPDLQGGGVKGDRRELQPGLHRGEVREAGFA